MSLLGHLLAAEMLRDGGLALTPDLRSMALAASVAPACCCSLKPDIVVARAGPDASIAERRVGVADLLAHVQREERAPIQLDWVGFGGRGPQVLAQLVELTGHPPELLLLGPDTAPITGYKLLSPRCPSIAVHQTFDRSERAVSLRARAEELATDGEALLNGLIEVDPIEGPLLGLEFLEGGAPALRIDPLSCLIVQDLDTARSAAIDGMIRLDRDVPRALRLPTLSMHPVEIEVVFAGSPPFPPPKVDLLTAGLCEAVAEGAAPTYRISCPAAPGAWFDIRVTGHRARVDTILLKLPTDKVVRPAPERDPLAQYRDPLDSYRKTVRR